MAVTKVFLTVEMLVVWRVDKMVARLVVLWVVLLVVLKVVMLAVKTAVKLVGCWVDWLAV